MTLDVTREKVEFYLNNKTTLFLKKNNGTFYIGLILECSDKHLIFFDRKVGEVFILFSEIEKIEPYKRKENGNQRNNTMAT